MVAGHLRGQQRAAGRTIVGAVTSGGGVGMTEGAVRASDKCARFVGAEAYEAAGGLILRDLFQPDDGGWWQDAGLLDRLARERLEREAEAIRAEGWRWVEAAPDFPYGHSYGLRRLVGEAKPLTEEQQAARDALQAEFDRLEQECTEADEVPEETDRRLAEIEEALAAFDDRPVAYDPEEMARAGVFVSIDGSGALRIERGYVRPEDEPPVTAEPEQEQVESDQPQAGAGPEGEPETGTTAPPAEPPEEDEGIRPLPDRLLTELTAHRTLALRDTLAADPQTAFLAALHALCLRLFYRCYGLDSCLEIEPKSALFSAQAPGLADATRIAIEIVRKPKDQIGFAVHPRRWVVERCFAWLGRNRRLAKDFEATIASATAFLYAASVLLLTRRLARST